MKLKLVGTKPKIGRPKHIFFLCIAVANCVSISQPYLWSNVRDIWPIIFHDKILIDIIITKIAVRTKRIMTSR